MPLDRINVNFSSDDISTPFFAVEEPRDTLGVYPLALTQNELDELQAAKRGWSRYMTLCRQYLYKAEEIQNTKWREEHPDDAI